MKNRLLFALLSAALGGLLVPAPAHAYLDPGSGSMLAQLAVAGFAGVAVALKVYWRRLVAFFQSRRSDSPRDKPSA